VEEGLDCRVIPFNSALPSATAAVGVPPSSSAVAAVAAVDTSVREGDVGSNSGNNVASSSSSSFSSDYLLSLSS